MLEELERALNISAIFAIFTIFAKNWEKMITFNAKTANKKKLSGLANVQDLQRPGTSTEDSLFTLHIKSYHTLQYNAHGGLDCQPRFAVLGFV